MTLFIWRTGCKKKPAQKHWEAILQNVASPDAQNSLQGEMPSETNVSAKAIVGTGLDLIGNLEVGWSIYTWLLFNHKYHHRYRTKGSQVWCYFLTVVIRQWLIDSHPDSPSIKLVCPWPHFPKSVSPTHPTLGDFQVSLSPWMKILQPFCCDVGFKIIGVPRIIHHFFCSNAFPVFFFFSCV